VTTRRLTFTVLSEASKTYRCNRCQRSLVTGERVTVTITGDLATFKHAGRSCPPAYNPRPL
jgi:hypothetical protein